MQSLNRLWVEFQTVSGSSVRINIRVGVILRAGVRVRYEIRFRFMVRVKVESGYNYENDKPPYHLYFLVKTHSLDQIIHYI